MRFVALLSCFFLTGGCVSSVDSVGGTKYPEKPIGTHIPVFTSLDSLKRPFEVIGKVSYFNAGIYQQLSIASSFEPLMEQARKIGADAVLITNHSRIYSGLFTRGVSTEGDAIRYK